MSSGNVIIDRTTDLCKLNRSQLRNSTDFNGVSFFVDLILGPNEFVRLFADLLWYNGLVFSDSKAPNTLLHLIWKLQQLAFAVVLLWRQYNVCNCKVDLDRSTLRERQK